MSDIAAATAAWKGWLAAAGSALKCIPAMHAGAKKRRRTVTLSSTHCNLRKRTKIDKTQAN